MPEASAGWRGGFAKRTLRRTKPWRDSTGSSIAGATRPGRERLGSASKKPFHGSGGLYAGGWLARRDLSKGFSTSPIRSTGASRLPLCWFSLKWREGALR
jgi:hypothetical protein